MIDDKREKTERSVIYAVTHIGKYLMEKYSSYRRKDLEAAGSTIAEQNEQLKEKLRSACDIEKIGYYLNLAEEKRIGKAHL